MVTYESAVTVNRPPEQVFPYLIEPAKQAKWSDVPMKRLDEEGDMRTGSRFEVTFGMGPVKATVGIELTKVETGSLMAWKSFSGPIGWQGEYKLDPADDNGTHLSQHGTLEFHGLWRLLEPLAGREIQAGEIKELEKLKAIVEAS